MRRLAFVLAALGAACSGQRSALPYYRSATMTPEWLSTRTAEAPTMHRVAAFQVTDQNGREITERAFAGRVTVVHFFFTQCGDICPTTTRNLAAVLADLRGADRVQVLSYSVAPQRASVAALRQFASVHGITDPRWHLLTGAPGQVERLAKDSYFVRLGDGATYGVASIAHTESVLLVDGGGRLRGVYAGSLRLEIDRLEADVRTLLAEHPSPG